MTYSSHEVPSSGSMVNPVTLKHCPLVDLHIDYSFAFHSHLPNINCLGVVAENSIFCYKAPPIDNKINRITLKLCMLVDLHIGYNIAFHSHLQKSIVKELYKKIAYFSHKAPSIGNMVNPMTLKLCMLVELHIGYNIGFHSHLQISIV